MFSEEISDDSEPPECCMSLVDDGDVVDDDANTPDEEFAELDPSGRYGRYAEVIGKGATKTVYRAYDKVDCKEVAWNKTTASSHAEDPIEAALAIEREVILLQRLNFKGIMKFYSAWVDEFSGEMNFVTELCSSTLFAFCLKHKCVSPKAVKNWARQILEGIVYLHTQDPPIIHRDLKCENIFVKSSASTSLKIGDFGSAKILNATHRTNSLVGTPEFMAPEMFEEDYDELVDVYLFGMCMLELLTSECPYSECTSLAQVYKHIVGGKKPKSLLKVNDVQALQFINRCLLPACQRPSAKELLDDPFLQHNGVSAKSMEPSDLVSLTRSVPGKLLFGYGSVSNEALTARMDMENLTSANLKENSNCIVSQDAACISEGASSGRSYQVVGTKEDANTVRLRIRMQESSNRSDIVFPYDLTSDSPRSVAEEMILSLGYPQSDLSTIAHLISEETVVLASVWKEGLAAPTCSQKSDCTWLTRLQTDDSMASFSSEASVESNAPFEKVARGSKEVSHEVSTLFLDEKSKKILYDNNFASSILDANLRLPVMRTVASDLDEKIGSLMASQIGSLYGGSSSIAVYNKSLHLCVLKNSLNLNLLRFSWRPPFKGGIR